MNIRYFAGLLATIAVAGSASADGGRIPIYQATTISQPGSYFVTRNITVSSGPVITIEASSVVLDLNGFTLTQLSGTAPVILMSGGVACSGGGGCHLNGKGTGDGGTEGVGDDGPSPKTVHLKHVTLAHSSSSAIHISNASKVVIEECEFVDPGGVAVDLTGPTGALGRIEFSRNRFLDVARANVDLRLLGFFGQIRENVLPIPPSPGPMPAAGAIVLTSSRGVLIEGNTLSGPTGSPAAVDGIAIDSTSVDVTVRHNAISGAPRNGIRVEGQGNVIVENTINRCDSSGISVSGSTNFIEGNRIGHNTGNGIFFVNMSGPHAYRGNFLRGNSSAGVGGIAGNTDGGGNIL